MLLRLYARSLFSREPIFMLFFFLRWRKALWWCRCTLAICASFVFTGDGSLIAHTATLLACLFATMKIMHLHKYTFFNRFSFLTSKTTIIIHTPRCSCYRANSGILTVCLFSLKCYDFHRTNDDASKNFLTTFLLPRICNKPYLWYVSLTRVDQFFQLPWPGRFFKR